MLGAVPTRIVLKDVEGHGIGALVHVSQDTGDVPVTCYPPDALALAIREQLPIYATASVLGHAEAPGRPGPEADQVADWLERVRPEDSRRRCRS